MSSADEKAKIKRAKFNIGELVIHQRQGYRAVIIDADPLFQPSGRYNPQACKRDFSTQNPWYRLLVDGCSQETYVEEPLLAGDSSQLTINNPQVEDHLVLQKNKYRTLLHRH
ncbi:MAG: heat shock protein HspQ [Legionellaceae bacterium]|nr:heat shock protein HspQ [Legionellaceae bacterium]